MSRDTQSARSGRLGAADPFTDDDAFFDLMRARMPERGQRIVKRLEKVKAVYVECGRDKVLREAFDAFLQNHFALGRGGRRSEAEVFFLTGESGAGKSAAVEHLLSNTPELQPITGS